LTGIWTFAARKKVKAGDFIYGAAAGIPNILTGGFLILALDALPGSIVFSFWDGVCVFLLSILGVVIWKEKLGRRGVIGIALTIIALVLIKWGE
jgi:multidrug transporter EmrE-like cation transporter